MNKIAFYIRRGILYTLAALLCRVVPASLVRFRYFAVFQLGRATNVDQRVHADCRWCESVDEIATAEAISRFDSKPFEPNVRASLARVDCEPVGAFWVAEQGFVEQELGIAYQLSPQQRWLFAAMVKKEHRGRGVFPQLLSYTTSTLFDSGSEQLMASVNPLNKASMSVFRAQSDGVIARVFAFKILNVAVCVGSGSVQIERTCSTNCKKNPIRLRFNGSDF